MKFATIAGTIGTIAAGAVIVATAPATPSSAAVTSGPIVRPACSVQLAVIRSAELGKATPRQLRDAGLHQLADAARAAHSITGARDYGIALDATRQAITEGNGQCAGGQRHDKALPAWFHWGNTRDRVGGGPCVIVWGRRLGDAGGASAEICASGWAGLS